jgi:hypothetical protein
MTPACPKRGFFFADNLLAEAPPGVSVLSAEYFNVTADVLQNYIGTLPDKAQISSITQLPFSWVDSCYALNNCTKPGFGCRSVCAVVAESFNMELGASYAILRLPNDPFEGPGMEWLYQARRALTRAQLDYPGYRFYLANGAAEEIDAVDEVYRVFPTAVAITVSLVIVLVGIAFRSLVIPLRSILSIATTLAFVYGAGVAIYQCGVLDFLHFFGLKGQGSLSWIVPIFSFSVLVGLSLDYDTFLLSRVTECRRAGYGDRHSIILGVTQTGSIITAAGVIMAIAFLGLLFRFGAGLVFFLSLPFFQLTPFPAEMQRGASTQPNELFPGIFCAPGYAAHPYHRSPGIHGAP